MIGRIEQFCIHYADPDFARLASLYDVEGEVRRIVEAVRGGNLSATVLADLDAVEEAFRKGGTAGVTSTVREFRAAPGTSAPGHPRVRVRRCPAPQRCPRLALPAEQPAPVCAITGTALAEDGLS